MLLTYHFGYYLMSLTIVRQDPPRQNWILNHRLYQPYPKAKNEVEWINVRIDSVSPPSFPYYIG